MNNKNLMELLLILLILLLLLIIAGFFIYSLTTKQVILDVEDTLNLLRVELENKTNIIENQEKEIENLKVLNKHLLEEKELLSVTNEYMEGKLYLNYLAGSLDHQKYLYDSGESISGYIYVGELNDYKLTLEEFEDLGTKLLNLMTNDTMDFMPETINNRDLVEKEIRAYNYLVGGYNAVLEVTQ